MRDDVGPYFAEALKRLDGEPLVGEARSLGLIGAVEIVSSPGTNQRFTGKEGKAGPMFNWSWGYYSIFDADAILYDVYTCGQTYSYYCNKALDDLVIQGRSTLDAKKRTEIYAKAQRLLFDDAAYVFKWGLRGVWGISNRVDYQAPADEIDRMFLVTPRKK